MPLDETGVLDANFGPSGFVEEGQYYEKGERLRLKHTYQLFDHAVELVKRETKGMQAWLLLLECYFGSEADPSLVARWRKDSPNRAQLHDWFINEVADKLGHKELYVVWPHRMTVKEESLLEKRNDELYAEYAQIKEEKLAEGLSKPKANKRAVETAAIRHGYSTSRVYAIVALREKKAG